MNKNETPELMKQFFDLRVEEYEEHMREILLEYSAYYAAIAKPIPETIDPILIVDLGCGTGLELAEIFQKAPYARIVGIDVCDSMTALLLEHYSEKLSQISILTGSYLEAVFPEKADYFVSSQTMHHLDITTKKMLYSRILKSLRPGGIYIEGDYTVSEEEEKSLAQKYKDYPLDGSYHIDFPFSVKTQINILQQSGFAEVHVLFQNHQCSVIYGVRQN